MGQHSELGDYRVLWEENIEVTEVKTANENVSMNLTKLENK